MKFTTSSLLLIAILATSTLSQGVVCLPGASICSVGEAQECYQRKYDPATKQCVQKLSNDGCKYYNRENKCVQCLSGNSINIWSDPKKGTCPSNYGYRISNCGKYYWKSVAGNRCQACY